MRSETPDGRDVPAGRRLKGLAQMAAGAVLVVVGALMCVLPGPGVAAVAAGVVLALRGQRNFSGRRPTRVERRLDRVAARLVARARQGLARKKSDTGEASGR